jgi:hypothetical protein
MRRWLVGLIALAALASPAAVSPALAQGAGFQVTAQDANMVEIRFHGVPLRGVHADDSQNALSLDFQQPVESGLFERLAGQLPQWVSMSYANFDNGIIRSPRPVTFLTRSEPDGFSLRIVARGAPGVSGGPAPQPQPQPMAPPPPMRGAYGPPPSYPPQQQAYIPPAMQAGFHTYGEYQVLRNYEAQELAVRRGDPMWSYAYGRAAMQGDSGIALRNETNWFHGGDLMLNTGLDGKFSFAPGIALIGGVTWTHVEGNNVRLADGSITGTTRQDVVTGDPGFAFELGRDTELKLQAALGNGVTGGKFTLYSGSPLAYAYLAVNYHNPLLDTPAQVAWRADKDDVTAGWSQLLGWGFSGSLAGHYSQYGVHGDASVARTAGWDGNLRWQTDVYDGLLMGLAYDGHGEYRTDFDTRAGAAPTPFVPLGIRNIENHAVTANLSSMFFGGLWFDAYAGYVMDRYASDGLLAGADLHYTPAPGVDLALGIRHSAVSYIQGESGRQTTAGINLNLGLGAPPQPSWMANQL